MGCALVFVGVGIQSGEEGGSMGVDTAERGSSFDDERRRGMCGSVENRVENRGGNEAHAGDGSRRRRCRSCPCPCPCRHSLRLSLHGVCVKLECFAM